MNADEQFATAYQVGNKFGIVICGLGPHVPLVFGTTGWTDLVSGQGQERNRQNETGLPKTIHAFGLVYKRKVSSTRTESEERSGIVPGLPGPAKR